jgi:hypothetical protein
LAAERKAFWERIGFMPSAHEISELEALHEWLMSVGNDNERRALLAWARSKVGGKSFRRWCFKVEGIHPNTGRARKDRALAQISAILVRNASQHSGSAQIRLLHNPPQISDVADITGDDIGERDCINSWIADGAFAKILSSENDDFSWAPSATRPAASESSSAGSRRRDGRCRETSICEGASMGRLHAHSGRATQSRSLT